jgi:hypothetical protein
MRLAPLMEPNSYLQLPALISDLFSYNMGQAISAIRETLTAGDAAAKKDVLEQLTFLVNAANAKLDKYQADLYQ